MSEIGQPPGQQFYLRLTIKDAEYNSINIMSLIIKEWVFNILPTIEIQFVDEGYLTEVFPLEDGEDINIVLAKHEDDENPVELTFSMDDYAFSVQGDNRVSLITITGHLKTDDIFLVRSRSFSKRNSVAVFEQIASESNLKFSNPHKIVTSDNMNWIQAGQSNYDFINHVLQRVYIPNDVAFFYANTSKEFVLTSLVSEIKKKEIRRSKYSIENYELNVKDEDDLDDTIWFASYSIVNYSGYFNKKVGYGFGYNYYNLDAKNTFKTFSTIPKISELSFRNKDMIDDVVNYNWNTVDYIDSNVYGPEYLESGARNKFLTDNFFANSLVLEANSLSQVKLMDTIDVDIPSLQVEAESNEAMSGFYLVAGIQHEVTNGGIYKKKIALGRNGMNKSPDVENYKVEVL